MRNLFWFRMADEVFDTKTGKRSGNTASGLVRPFIVH